MIEIYAHGATVNNPIQASSFESLTLKILDGVVDVLIPFMILAVVWTGTLLVFSIGKPEAMVRSRNHLLWTLIGFIIVLAAKGILKVVETTVKDVQEIAVVYINETVVPHTLQNRYV